MKNNNTKSKNIRNKSIRLDGYYLIFWARKIHLTYLVLIFIIAYFLIVSIRKTMINDEIYIYGQETIAVVDEIKKVGGKGKRRCYYHFILDNKKYTGKTDDDFLNIGDSLKIKYLLNDPMVNRADKFLKNRNK